MQPAAHHIERTRLQRPEGLRRPGARPQMQRGAPGADSAPGQPGSSAGQRPRFRFAQLETGIEGEIARRRIDRRAGDSLLRCRRSSGRSSRGARGVRADQSHDGVVPDPRRHQLDSPPALDGGSAGTRAVVRAQPFDFEPPRGPRCRSSHSRAARAGSACVVRPALVLFG